MGQPLTINNTTPDEIFVEWRSSPGGLFKVASYNIGGYQKRSHSVEAWWYEIYIYHKGRQFVRNFNGAQPSNWAFNGN